MSGVPRENVRTLRGHQGAVLAVKFNGDGSYCMSGGSDRRLCLWNPHREGPDGEEGFLVKTYSGPHGYEIQDLVISHDNAKFVSCGGDKIVFLWDVATGKVIRRFQGHFHRVNAAAMNADGTVILSGSYDKTIRCWDVRAQNSYEPIQILDHFKDSVTGIVVTADQIIASSVDGFVRIFDLRMGKVFADNIHESVCSVQLSNDRNCILANGLDNRIRLLEKDSGELLTEYVGHLNNSYRVQSCFSHNDAYVFSGSEDNSIFCWDLVEGNVITKLIGHKGIVNSAAFHPTQTMLLSGAYDGSVKVWV